MTLMQLLILLIIAAICGSIGQAIAGFDLGGCLVNIVVGFIGAYIGLWISRKMGWPEMLNIKIGKETFPVLWSILGSVAFTLIVGLIRSAAKGKRY